MASKSGGAKLLTVCQQKQSIKGVQKSKKNVAKNTLESPFTLDWPVITAEHERELTSLLRKSCFGLKKIYCKPPWKEVQKLKGAERKAYLKTFHNKFLNGLDPDGLKQVKEREEALSNLILGYNAVMRALEKDCVAGIFIKKNVKPAFIVKTFLPGCANKCIPLIPLDDLDGLLKHEETLAIPHACMVLGLKSCVAEDTNRFNPLLAKMCQAVNVNMEDVTDEESDKEQMESSVDDLVTDDNKENKANQSNDQLTVEQIQLYHLKRSHKSKRIFIPGEGTKQKVDTMGIGSDYVGFGSVEEDEPPTRKMKQLINRRPMKVPVEVPTRLQSELEEEKEKVFRDLKSEDFSSLFLIDETGDKDMLLEKRETMKEESKGEEKSTVQFGKVGKKRKLKSNQSKVHPYVSAKTKRVKNNPNRKERKKK